MSAIKVSLGQAPAWCIEHEDFAWRFEDDSGGCFYAQIVEMGTSECELVPLKSLQHASRWRYEPK